MTHAQYQQTAMNSIYRILNTIAKKFNMKNPHFWAVTQDARNLVISLGDYIRHEWEKERKAKAESEE